MKLICRALSAALLAAFAAGASAGPAEIAGDFSVRPQVTAAQAKPRTALIIGNSYTYYNCGLFDYLWGFSGASAQTKLESEIATIAGAGLDWHDVEGLVNPAGDSWKFLFKKENGRIFDAVILQGNSREPIDPRMKESFARWAGIHAATIRKTGAEPLLMMTWAREGQPEMTQALADATTAVANANAMRVIPVGLAFAEVKRLYPEITLIMPDKSHPTAAGSYLASAVIWSALMHESLSGNSFLGGCEKPLSADTAKKLQEAAWTTVRTFYGWEDNGR